MSNQNLSESSNPNHLFKPESSTEALSDIDIVKILSILKKSILWILLINIIIFITVFFILRYTAPIYRSTSAIKLTIKNEKAVSTLQGILGGASGGGVTSADATNIIGEIAFIQSEIVAKEVIKIVGLDVSYFLKGTIMDSEIYLSAPFVVSNHKETTYLDQPIYINILSLQEYKIILKNGKTKSKKFLFGEQVDWEGLNFTIKLINPKKISGQNYNFYFKINSERTLINYVLGKNLEVGEANRDAKIISINFKEENPDKAKAIVAGFDSAYAVKSVEEKNKSNVQMIQYLTQQGKQFGDSLAKYDALMQGFFLENKTKNTDEKLQKVITELETITKEQQKIATELGLYNELQVLIASGDSLKEFMASLPLFKNEAIGKLVVDYQLIMSDMQKVYLREKNNTLTIKSYQQDLKNKKKQLTDFLTGSQKLIYKGLRELNEKKAEIESILVGLPPKGREYTQISRNYARYDAFYNNILNNLFSIRLTSAGVVPEIIILSPANKPYAPISPIKLQYYLVAIVLSLVLSVGLVIIRYLLHNTLMNQNELEKLLTVPLLGGIPEYKNKDEKMEFTRLVVTKNPKSSLNESIRAIRTNLDYMLPSGKRLFDENSATLLSVTSTISGEGKTFVATNLSGIIAMTDKKVIILDFDMRKPKLNLAFGLDNLKGVADILSGKAIWQECVRDTEIDTLKVITAGPPPPNPSELILRDDLDILLNNLKQNFDVIMIDTPPVGLVTDGILIMKKVDLPMYIVRAGYSKRFFIKGVNRVAQVNQFKNMSVIMNAVKRSVGGYGGYGNYGGYYGGYYGGGYYEEGIENKSKKSLFQKVKDIFSSVKKRKRKKKKQS
ncbi:MAG: polysaccharide biosynthesis tyrosine autokinase [Cytophagales bacterium]|nr:MAG: polysaccharide biosynthesis tyrosine autokinase [Cytophagales bacterium]TAH29646.1 MAG: polysaccharide biosynthesis tyrosine autokinase [Cytophagales bacterium]